MKNNELDNTLTHTSIEKASTEDKHDAKRRAINCTITSSILFLVFSYVALIYTSLILSKTSENPFTTAASILSITCAACIPLSMLISIYLMWSRYFRGQYKKVRFFSRVPLIVSGGICFLLWILDSWM